MGEVKPEQIEGIARLAHHINSIYRHSLGESVESWLVSSDATRASAIDGVRARLSGKTRSPEESHQNWYAFKEAEGYTYGPEKDEQKKTHPCFLPYDKLPEAQRIKDTLFMAVVDGAAALLEGK